MIILAPFAPEYEIAKKRFGLYHEVILLGVGPRNAMETLLELKLPRYANNLMLFGFAGSNTLPMDTEVFVTESYLHQFHGSYDDKPCILRRPEIEGAPEIGVPCYSSSDFVVETKVKEPAIFDMELAFLTLFHPNITSWRIVSDNLNLQEFEDYYKK